MKNKSASDRQSRKRELDRKAQRSARERAKSRMAHLETLVAHFQETDSDVRFSSLTDRLSEAIDERDNLRSLLESVNFAIRSHLDKTPVNKGLSSSSTACRDSSGQSLQSGPGFISTDGSIVSQAVPPECECMLGTAENTAITLSIWRELNELFKSLPEADLAAEDQEGEHVIIRAVLEGWDKIGETGQLSTTCRKLRRLDELVWVHCNPADRLAILSLIHLMVVSQNSAGQTELPRWLQAR
ncbi:hypothetical protein N0V84_010046 [Fusarium piperis]|uniref:BZIP domain-containing protein n=1 Tax=Fusarium piperis TaxID=1435070 RepID=A0A9W9BH40_9HYPO|nr:hypothetical protein N0V84_010046 [Fusarium piperis]